MTVSFSSTGYMRSPHRPNTPFTCRRKRPTDSKLHDTPATFRWSEGFDLDSRLESHNDIILSILVGDIPWLGDGVHNCLQKHRQFRPRLGCAVILGTKIKLHLVTIEEMATDVSPTNQNTQAGIRLGTYCLYFLKRRWEFLAHSIDREAAILQPPLEMLEYGVPI